MEPRALLWGYADDLVILGFFAAIIGFAVMVIVIHEAPDNTYRFEQNFMERRSDGSWHASPFAFAIMLTLLLFAASIAWQMVHNQPVTELISLMAATFGIGQVAQRGITAMKDVELEKAKSGSDEEKNR